MKGQIAINGHIFNRAVTADAWVCQKCGQTMSNSASRALDYGWKIDKCKEPK